VPLASKATVAGAVLDAVEELRAGTTPGGLPGAAEAS
jgi:hypothetical protein